MSATDSKNLKRLLRAVKNIIDYSVCHLDDSYIVKFKIVRIKEFEELEDIYDKIMSKEQ